MNFNLPTMYITATAFVSLQNYDVQGSKLRPMQSICDQNTIRSRKFATYHHFCSFETKGLAVAPLLLVLLK